MRRRTAPSLIVRAGPHGRRSRRFSFQTSRHLSRADGGAIMRTWSRAQPRRLPISACGPASASPSWAKAMRNGSSAISPRRRSARSSYGIYPTASAAEVEYQMRDGGAAFFVAEDQEYVDKLLPLDRALARSASRHRCRRFRDVRLRPSQARELPRLIAAAEGDFDWLEAQVATAVAGRSSLHRLHFGHDWASQGSAGRPWQASRGRRQSGRAITRRSRPSRTAPSPICRSAMFSGATSR